jgi:uncharacterized membrane protein YebE (DUF533 family)
VDASEMMSIFLRGVLGSGGRKRARRAARFVSGRKGFLSASTLVGVAGVAWGIYDSLQSTAGGPGAGVPAPAAAGTPGTPAALAPSGADDVLRLVRLAISAARADGTLTADEREVILRRAREAGLERIVEDELAQVRPLAAIAAGVTDAARREDLYVLAFSIVRADESVTGGERIYLAQLAHQLGLDSAATARLEQKTAAAIDEAGEDGPAHMSSGAGDIRGDSE